MATSIVAGTPAFTKIGASTASSLLLQIAEHASTIRSLAFDQIDEGGENFDDAKAIAIRELAGHVGYVADYFSAHLLGVPGLLGTAEDWLLPDSYISEAGAQGQLRPTP
jgi:hypothetical protein